MSQEHSPPEPRFDTSGRPSLGKQDPLPQATRTDPTHRPRPARSRPRGLRRDPLEHLSALPGAPVRQLLRLEARAEPHPVAPRSPPRPALSLARERFAETGYPLRSPDALWRAWRTKWPRSSAPARWLGERVAGLSAGRRARWPSHALTGSPGPAEGRKWIASSPNSGRPGSGGAEFLVARAFAPRPSVEPEDG